jgi:diguanylate cyclase (GGDEF)-like protein
MFNPLTEKTSSLFLESEEKAEIKHRVDLEIAKIAARMAFVGGLANIISGLVFVWIVHLWAGLDKLVTWYTVLLLGNVANIALNFYFKDRLIYPKSFRTWRILLLTIFIIICLTWGSIPIFFQAPAVTSGLAILAFLLAVVIGFSFPSICDFKLAIISIGGLLLPTIVLYLYRGFQGLTSHTIDPTINFAIGSSFFILALFLLVVTRTSSKLVVQFFNLSFTNAVLNHKLENINRFLEERVKERTLELEKTLKQVTYRATHDLLTNLPNQQSLITYMNSEIETAKKNNTMFAVIFFSINEIERIYNALGYQSGDHIIKAIADRFTNEFPEPTGNDLSSNNYIVTLLRNEIFVILVNPINELTIINEKIKPLFSILNKPIYTEKQVIKLTASIGISLYPRNGQNVTSLLMNADAAMLVAKQMGGNAYKMYKAEINAAITQQLELGSKLHTALVQSEFILQYQPIILLSNRKIVGAEALVRWENPTYGRIPPDQFIPLAEANGIIIPLGEWVLRTACEQIHHWHQQGFHGLKMAVNLSARQLHSAQLISSFLAIVKEYHLDPNCIEFELTETAAFQSETIPVLQELKSIGFGLSIDDFGTGYSGLTNIKVFDIDKIKIDKSFVQDVTTNSESEAIVANMINLAKKINVSVVAEGVETKEQLDFLISHNCEMIQGYYFSRPVDPEIFTEFLKNRNIFSGI